MNEERMLKESRYLAEHLIRQQKLIINSITERSNRIKVKDNEPEIKKIRIRVNN